MKKNGIVNNDILRAKTDIDNFERMIREEVDDGNENIFDVLEDEGIEYLKEKLIRSLKIPASYTLNIDYKHHRETINKKRV